MTSSRMALLVLGLLPVIPAVGQTIRLQDAGRLRPAGFEFGEIGGVAITPTGVVLVADQGNQRIYRFAADNRFIDSVGHAGAGPGEFRVFAGIAASRDGGWAIADVGLRRVMPWAASGRAGAAIRIEEGTPVGIVGWDAGPLLRVTDFSGTLRIVDADPQGPRVVGVVPVVPPGASPDDRRGCVLCPAIIRSSGTVLMAATEDSTWRLLEFDRSGEVIARWVGPARQAAPRSASELDELAQRMQRGPGAGPGSPEGRPPRPDLSRYRYPPRIRALGEDGSGRTWVLARHRGPGAAALDVFSPAGRHITTVWLAERPEGMAVQGRRMVTWGVDADGEPTIWRHEIVDE